jgi:hypothetical protein
MRAPLWLSLLVLCALCSAQTVTRIDRLKDACLETPLVRGGAAQVVIAPGEGPIAARCAAAVAEEIQRRSAVAVRVLPPDFEDFAALERTHCIALGDCNTNRVIGRLYAMRLCFVDGVYPGAALADPGFDLDANNDGAPDLWGFSTPTGPTHTCSLDKTVFRSAPASVHIAGSEDRDNARACVMGNLPAKPGKSYRAELWYRSRPQGAGRPIFHVDFYDGASPAVQIGVREITLPPAEDWTRATLDFEVPGNAALCRLLLYQYGRGDVWYDDLALYEAGSNQNLLAEGTPGAVAVTIHDPWGTQRSVIVLGASEPVGLERATDLFLAALPPGAQGELTAPDMMAIEVGEGARRAGIVPSGGPDDAAIARQAASAKALVDSNAFVPVRDVMQGTKGYARNWTLTGDARWAQMYAAIWRVILDSPASSARGPMEWTFNTLEGWDLMDECPALDDSLKLEILNRLLEIGVRNEQSYGRNVANTNRLIVDGHQLDQGLCIFLHGLYFDRYYHINGHWMTLAAPLLELGEKTPRVHDSYAYGPILGNDFMSEYALKTGDLDYFTSGNAREQVRWQGICSDNLNAGGTFGDDGAWRGSPPIGLFWKAAWFYRDPSLRWFARGSRPPVGFFAENSPATEPSELLGVAVAPINERLYQSARATRKDPEARKWPSESVPPERAFDKLSLRAGFGSRDQYLLVDGISVLSHGHEDGASILRFTDNDRLFLTEGHYVEIAARRHNTLLVTHDGQSFAPPPLASLETKASLPGAGLVQVLTSAYNGVDWRRSLLWFPELACLVVDEVAAREPGDYSFELLWRTLGDVSLSPGRFTVDQMGEAMTIIAPGSMTASVREQLDYHGINYYASYPFCRDGLVKELWESQVDQLAAGESRLFCNAIQTHSSDAQPFPVRQVGPAAWLLDAPTGRILAGVGPSSVAGLPQTDAQLWAATESGSVYLANATRWQWGNIRLTAAQPVSVSLSANPPRLAADGPLPCTVEVSSDAGRATLAAPGALALSLTDLREPFSQLQLLPEPVPTQRPPTQAVPELTRRWSWPLPPLQSVVTNQPGVTLTANPAPLAESTWTSEYRIDPKRLLTNWDDIVLWPEDVGAEILVQLPSSQPISRLAVRTMCTNNSARGIKYRLAKLSLYSGPSPVGPWAPIREFTQDTEPALGTYPEYVADTPGLEARCLRIVATPQPGCALFLKGIRAIGPPTARTSQPGVEAWETSSLSALCAVAGKPGTALAGLRDGRLVALQEGRDLWTAETGAKVNCLAVGDLTGDASPEILAGTDGQRLVCFSSEGKVLWSRDFPDFWGRRGNPQWLGVGDVDGDGRNEVVASVENWHYYCLEGADGAVRWAFEVEHSGLEGAIGDINGDGKLETLCGQEYYGFDVLDSAGKRLFVVGAPGPISTAALCADLTGDGAPEALFGAQTCGVYVRDGRGQAVVDANVGGFVNDLAPLASPDGPLVVAAADSPHLNLVALSSAGAKWRITLPGRPLALAPLGAQIAAACSDGGVRIADSAGALRAASLLAGPARLVAAADLDGDDRPELIAGADRELACFSIP